MNSAGKYNNIIIAYYSPIHQYLTAESNWIFTNLASQYRYTLISGSGKRLQHRC